MKLSLIEAGEYRIPQNFPFLEEFFSHLIHSQNTFKLKAQLPVL